MPQSDNYSLLIQKLDAFTRKYYINQVIRGLLYSIGLILLLFLGMTLLENYFYFSTSGRKLLFFSFVAVSVLALAGWVLLPLARYFRLGSVISHEKAAQIVGAHFTNVKDKLLNVLQLRHQANAAGGQELILASINQKSAEISPVPFRNAIDLKDNRRYLRYALPPLLLLLLILVVNAGMITNPAERLLKNGQTFERPAPFHFNLQGADDLTVVQYEDFPITVEVDGEVLPNEVFIDVDDYQYRMTKTGPGTFTYTFNGVQKETDFRIFSGLVETERYALNVLKKPNILGFEIKLDYPAYTGRKDETLNNIGDMVVPIGTQLDWVFNSEHTDDVTLAFSGNPEETPTERFADALFTYQKRALKDERYQLFVGNDDLPRADSVAYSISVIPDQYPVIKVEKFEDSLDTKTLYFVGDAADDYGLHSLTFNYRIKKEDGTQGELRSEPIAFGGGKQARYNHLWNVADLGLAPGDELSYFFETFDNDAVNGRKSARTNVMLFSVPTEEEYEAQEEANNEEIKDKLEEAMKESKKIKEEMKALREKLLQKKEMDWQDKKELEKLLERQKELQNELKDAQKAFEENMKNQEEFSNTEEKTKEKQEKLQELFEEAQNQEMQELMRKIEELQQELNKDEALDLMEQFEQEDEEMEMDLDRLKELFKELELEAEMERTIDKLEELAEEQEELSEETKEAEENKDEMSEQEQQAKQEELKEKQEELNEEFEKVQEQMDEMEKKNAELEKPKEMDPQEEQQEQIEQDMQESQENLEKQDNKKASQKQKDAAQKMQQMAQQMQQQQQGQQMEQMQEDMEALRQLLENLMGISFEQEDLIEQFDLATVNTPRYVELVQTQFKLKDDFRLVEDSLQALSKRVIQIESFVTEKVLEVKENMKESIEQLEERKQPQAANYQQRSMKNVNDLALMLSEVMDQMQQQMSGMMSGQQMCSKPGGQGGKPGNVPMDKITKGQGELNKEMQEKMKGKKDGKGQGGGEGGTSEEFAKMAAQQAALRQALREKQKALQEQGKGKQAGELQDLIDAMNKVETDLVNKRLNNEMLQRQQDILTRLLEAEKAERERKFDNKRKAETAEQYERKFPPSLEEYIKKREAEIEQYKTVSPSLRPYYKFLVQEYYNELKN